jgi:hypothetical protein
MNIWILILWFSGSYKATSVSIEFNSQQACETALIKVHKDFDTHKGYFDYVDGTCVSKSN